MQEHTRPVIWFQPTDREILLEWKVVATSMRMSVRQATMVAILHFMKHYEVDVVGSGGEYVR